MKRREGERGGVLQERKKEGERGRGEEEERVRGGE